MTDEDRLSPDEQARFDGLPREIDPPAHLEGRTVRHLRQHGALARRWSRSLLATAAAVIIAFGAGAMTHRLWSSAPDPPAGQRYLLLLYGAPSTSPAEEAARTAEYGEWARVESANGSMESGEKLADDVFVTGNPRIAGEQPLGFFIFRTASRRDAEAIAGRCPHVRHGGTVVVKPIAR